MGMEMRTVGRRIMVILNVINLSYCFIFFNLNRSLTKDLINSLSMKSMTHQSLYIPTYCVVGQKD